MKKNIAIHICRLLAFSVMLTACDDYLEEVPDNRVELNTLEKSSQLLTNAYSSAGYNFTEWMGDLVTYTLGTTKRPEHNQSYQWEEVTGIEQDTPTNFWNSTYEAIAHANEVLAVVDNLPGEEARRSAVKGEALLARAYGHFMLVNLFAEHYDASTASRDMGVPYVDEPETEFIKQYKRNSVKEVYDRIEKDLLQGLELVNDAYYANSGKYHFTKNAALAFASRFYLFRGDPDNCINYSSRLLGSNPDAFVKDIAALQQQKVNTEDYIRLYTSPNDQSNLLLIRQVTNFHVNVAFWPDSEIYYGLFQNNPFRAEDIRADPAWVRGENGLSATKFEFLFERSSLTSNVGLNYTIALAFRGEEVLLNRAESYVLQNRLDDALADMQVLARKRYGNNVTVDLETIQSSYYPNNPQIACLIYVLEERAKEFMHEGLRWFDLKRYEFPVNHTLPDGSVITLKSDDKRKLLQIPQAAIDVGGLKPNPR